MGACVVAIVQHKRVSQSGTSWSAAFNSNVTAGNLVAFFVLEADDTNFAGFSTGPGDGLGNTYVNAGFDTTAQSLVSSGYYAKNIAGGACTIAGTFAIAINGSLDLFELSGRDVTTPMDVAQFTGVTDNSAVEPTVSIMTTAAGDDILVGVSKSGQITTVSSPFTDALVAQPQNWTGSAYAANQAAATYTPTWTKLADGKWTIGAMAFKASGMPNSMPRVATYFYAQQRTN